MPVRIPVGPRHMRGEHMFPRPDVPLLCRRYRHGDHYPHDHDFIEIATVLSGRGQHLSMYGDRPLSAGDVFVLRPGAWHAYRSRTSFLLYNLCIGTDLLQRELAWVRDDPRLGYLLWTAPIAADGPRVLELRLPARAARRCTLLLDHLRDAIDAPRRTGRAGCIGPLLAYLDVLSRHLGPVHQPRAAATPVPHRLVTQGIHLLEQDITHPWTLRELADHLRTDESYLARVFRAGTGLTPMAYVSRARVERAAVLLLTTRDPVGVVGQRVGWDDANYFARRFKAHTGMTASQYRANHATLPTRS